jgi:glycine/D-amino acid oxidase-like deaminating enzyme
MVGDHRADVAVIGAGYTGLSAALHLARSGAKVAVLERATIGYGGSGRNVGLVNAGLWLPPDDVAGMMPGNSGERLIALLGDAPSLVFQIVADYGIECEVVHSGTLHCAVGRDGARNLELRHEQWHRRGAPVRLLGQTEALAAIGSGHFSAALLDSRAGTIQPLAYVRGLARAAAAAGAVIYEGAEVNQWTSDGHVARILTQGGSVQADALIIATNAYSQSIGNDLRSELAHLPYFNVATTPLSAKERECILPGGQGAWDTKKILSSFRLDAAGRLIFGSVGALSGLGKAAHLHWARRAIGEIFPQIELNDFEHAWFGTIGMTSDAIPRLHRLAANVFSISGYNGRGIAPGTAFGKSLADHLTVGAALPLPESRPVRMPLRVIREQTYKHGSALVHFASERV